jgi:hypothetical protein
MMVRGRGPLYCDFCAVAVSAAHKALLRMRRRFMVLIGFNITGFAAECMPAFVIKNAQIKKAVGEDSF